MEGGSQEGIQRLLGRRMRALRRGAGLTQREVAERARIDLKHYGAIERGQRNVTLETVGRVARVLRVEPYELLLPPGAVATADVPESDRIALLLEQIDAEQRAAVIQVLEGFARYRPARGGRRARR